jgi:hypothetical protein
MGNERNRENGGYLMANFDLSKYETVEQRHARAIEAYPDLRSVIINRTTPADRAQNLWVVEARVYLDAGDQANDLPKATEYAFEIDGQGMANKTSALENAATSALGRALRWALGGSKGPSREEMEKASRGVTPKVPAVDWRDEVSRAVDVAELTALHGLAVEGGYATPEYMAALSERKAQL